MSLLGVAAPGLHSQQTEFGPYKFDLKIRLGLYGGDLQQTKYDNKIIGFGFQARREMFGPGRAIAAEITWEHVPSRWQNLIDFETHNQYNMDDPSVPAGTFRKLSLHPFWSYDGRKESAHGISLAVSYHSKMPTGFGWQPLDAVLENAEWYAGIRLDRYKVYSEFRWQFYNQSDFPEITPSVNPSGTPPRYTVGGNGAFHEEGASLAPGAFAGIRYSLNDSFALEVGTRYFGTKHWDMTPGVYYGEEKYRISTGTSYGLGIEFALVCKL
ncbi:MAG: hypothetical protein LBC63_06415 [Holophagales bacterium]|jgi:hypothetical protein|nr:hypothetical protein [Holophagales bacterium]